jgi:hypothetical protein
MLKRCAAIAFVVLTALIPSLRFGETDQLCIFSARVVI